MSFSGDVKEELCKRMPSARHCQMAELMGLINSCGQIVSGTDGKNTIEFVTERESVLRKGFTLIQKNFNIGGEFAETDAVDPLMIQNSCCQRAYLRGFFLGNGSVSDPQKAYHLEFVCRTEEAAKRILKILSAFDIEGKQIVRKKNYIVYIKDGESISLLLNVMEAPLSLMELENTRIYKDVCNDVNRRMNCEMSNIRKTVSASSRQVEDILYIRDNMGIDKLSPQLAYMAHIRLEYPEMPLKELGEIMDPPIGKSGVNHRLRKLGEIAQTIRDSQVR